jgi:thymidylate synthase ThyX
LLAASGARYSRNNEGLERILSRIDPANLDSSVESIFRMIDYGHQSIADMVPVAMFIDGISILLAFHNLSLCPTAGGQESSTRYIKLSADGLIAPEKLGIPASLKSAWLQSMEEAFESYNKALSIWEDVAVRLPTTVRIPAGLLEDSSEAAAKKVARMRRNYAFDRARYFLPVAAKTNVMLLMSARGWVQLCQGLLSHPLPEAAEVGAAIRSELRLAAPRMLKHAEAKPSVASGIQREFERLRQQSVRGISAHLTDPTLPTERAPIASLSLMAPNEATPRDFTDNLELHDNRYAWIGSELRRTAVRFRWEAVALAEIRDLNRHRTGTRFCPLIPQGFYLAADQVPTNIPQAHHWQAVLNELGALGRRASHTAHMLLAEGHPSYIYWTLLGTQYPFEHLTTADKFIYEAEIRTGLGAHFRYARHLHDVLELWYERYPETRGLILEGGAEPE